MNQGYTNSAKISATNYRVVSKLTMENPEIIYTPKIRGKVDIENDAKGKYKKAFNLIQRLAKLSYTGSESV